MTTWYFIKDGGYSQAIFAVSHDKQEAVELWRKAVKKYRRVSKLSTSGAEL
jgi:hypothetical protein